MSNASFIKAIHKQKPAESNYWKYETLINQPKKNISHQQFADSIKTITSQYLGYLKPEKNTISLTGGKDSRTILSALLSLGDKPFSFTYGNKNTSDSYFAKKIADGLVCNYSII